MKKNPHILELDIWTDADFIITVLALSALLAISLSPKPEGVAAGRISFQLE